jgi:hypothetical protein
MPKSVLEGSHLYTRHILLKIYHINYPTGISRCEHAGGKYGTLQRDMGWYVAKLYVMTPGMHDVPPRHLNPLSFSVVLAKPPQIVLHQTTFIPMIAYLYPHR